MSAKHKAGYIFLILLVVGLAIVATVALVLLHRESETQTACRDNEQTTTPTSGSSSTTYPWGRARVGQFRYAAVATDTDICSKIGTNVLASQGGSAVDAAVAAMFCAGVVQIHSVGIGGGHFMTVYDTPRGESAKIMTTFLSREVAPGAATQTMFVNKTDASTVGGLAVGVPGEVLGLFTAWQKFGRVDWKELVAPSIHICQDGLRVGNALAERIIRTATKIKADANFRKLLVKQDGSLVGEGDVIKMPELARTLQQISDDPMSFYKGSLAKDIVADLQEYDSIITEADLDSYTTKEKPPVAITLQNGNYTLFSPRPPSSGIVLQFILKILDGYQMGPQNAEQDNIGQMYQHITEAFKFGFSERSALGDEDFVDIAELLANMSSPDYAEATRLRINDTFTQDVMYYRPKFEIVDDHGTTHLSIVAPDGSAVALTSTINYTFGGIVRGRRTGILFNNEMDDFSTPGTVNIYGVSASPTNYIEPGKMPMSSMSPTLIMDSRGRIVYVVGASGGPRIITATALMIINNLWLDKDLQSAIEPGRLHHQLLPNSIKIEKNFDQNLLEILHSYGHASVVADTSQSVVQVIHNKCGACPGNSCLGEPCIHAACDARKDGVPDGF